MTDIAIRRATTDDLLDAYPRLTAEDIRAALITKTKGENLKV